MSASLAISADSETEINFEAQILPILQNRCFSCHSAPRERYKTEGRGATGQHERH